MVFLMHIVIVMKEAFLTGWLGSTNRLFLLADVLVEYGHKVTLLASRYTNYKIQKKIDDKFPGTVIRTKHSGCYPAILDYFAFSRRIWRVLWKIQGKEKYFLNLSIGWSEKIMFDSFSEKLTEKNGKPDLVWGVCGGYLDGLNAARKIALENNLPLVLEMHDPPWHAGLLDDYPNIVKVYKDLLLAADKTVINTMSYKQELGTKFQILPECLHEIPQCYEKINNDFLKEDLVNDCFVMTYVGMLSEDRPLEPVLDCMKNILDGKGFKKLYLHIYGKGPRLEKTLGYAKKLKMDQYVKYLGFTERRIIVDAISNSDLNIIIQSNDACRFEVPGKLFEYIGVKRGILGIMEKCETEWIIETSGIGRCFSADNLQSITDYIFGCINNKIQGKKQNHIDEDFLMRFNRDTFVSKIMELIKSINAAGLSIGDKS